MRYGLIGLAGAMVLASTMATAGCSSSDEGTEGTGASSSSDGTGDDGTGGDGTGGEGTGGASTGGSGGAPATGGVQASGGAPPTGGAPASGGALATGGAPASGGTQAGGGDSVTTLSGTTALNALTEAEVTQLCDDTWAYFASAISAETFCKYRGLSFATSSSAPSEEDLRANCTEKENACRGDPGTAWSGNPGCSAPSSDCMATVAEYSTCIRDTAADFTQTVNGMPSCGEFTSGAEGTGAVWDFKGADRLPSCTFDNCATLWPADPKNI